MKGGLLDQLNCRTRKMGNFADGSLENWFLLLMDGETISDRNFKKIYFVTNGQFNPVRGDRNINFWTNIHSTVIEGIKEGQIRSPTWN